MEEFKKLAEQVLGPNYKDDPGYQDMCVQIRNGTPSYLVREDLRAREREQNRAYDSKTPPYSHGW